MQKFIGTKVVTATPMNRQQYNDYRDWPLPDDEDGTVEGYLVEYQDGGKPNHPDHTGYISWSPKAQFDAAYRPTDGLTFGLAIEALKRGERVARAGWNGGKGMWLALVLPYTEAVHSGDKSCFCYRAFELPNGANGDAKKSPNLLPYIAMKTVSEELVPWLASQTDMLAEDYMILPDLTPEKFNKPLNPLVEAMQPQQGIDLVRQTLNGVAFGIALEDFKSKKWLSDFNFPEGLSDQTVCSDGFQPKKYYVCVTLDEKSGGWMVTCSAVPELNAVGTDVNDALKQAVDALATCKMLYESQGVLLPNPLPAGDGELWWISNSGAYGTV